ncbi:hypothetical protein [Opitutus terrae]|uniref:Secreted protein n=1 Tax=Opitutus terrae (strain DSM 11246 / JCM 15787 / PB90-1) TaxID=452637 RepID=B1ZWS4_OPITP|nr:hypothetical protein [Opitutus terrae]ACB74201.1 hypothetical protein Oter_0913 [Opitutus terrae PB90-1]
MASSVYRLLLGLALSGAGIHQAAAADSLADSSPFLPPAGQGQTAATPDATLELRGIMGTGDDTRFSIYDATKRMSAWKRLNEPGSEFVVRSYDPSRDAVTIDYQGRTLTLTLKTAKVASAPLQPLPAPALNAPGPGSPQPIGGPVVLNPTPADEQRRLEAIAAEVNRRRMIRQQALQASRAAAGQSRPQSPGAPNPQGR